MSSPSPKKLPAGSMFVRQFNLLPSLHCADPADRGAFVLEAGWNLKTTLTGVVRVEVARPLPDAKILLDFRGETHTAWTNEEIVRAWDTQPTLRKRRFAQVIEVVWGTGATGKAAASSSSSQTTKGKTMKPSPTSPIRDFPFSISLPATGLPPSFEDRRGEIRYSLACTLSWMEPLRLLRTTRDLLVPVVVRMPAPAIERLLSNPSEVRSATPEESNSSEPCSYELRIPTRVVRIGHDLVAEIGVRGQVVSVEASAFRKMEFRAPAHSAVMQHDYSAKLLDPTPIATERYLAPSDPTSPSHPATNMVKRVFRLKMDPTRGAIASIESPLISHSTLLSLRIFVKGITEPHVNLEIPVVLVPAEREVVPEPAQVGASGLDVIQGTRMAFLGHRSKAEEAAAEAAEAAAADAREEAAITAEVAIASAAAQASVASSAAAARTPSAPPPHGAAAAERQLLAGRTLPSPPHTPPSPHSMAAPPRGDSVTAVGDIERARALLHLTDRQDFRTKAGTASPKEFAAAVPYGYGKPLASGYDAAPTLPPAGPLPTPHLHAFQEEDLHLQRRLAITTDSVLGPPPAYSSLSRSASTSGSIYTAPPLPRPIPSARSAMSTINDL
ncbi:hypothetical protein BDK51DRAFT_38511, partial [Blyttiomyces helicus]